MSEKPVKEKSDGSNLDERYHEKAQFTNTYLKHSSKPILESDLKKAAKEEEVKEAEKASEEERKEAEEAFEGVEGTETDAPAATTEVAKVEILRIEYKSGVKVVLEMQLNANDALLSITPLEHSKDLEKYTKKLEVIQKFTPKQTIMGSLIGPGATHSVKEFSPEEYVREVKNEEIEEIKDEILKGDEPVTQGLGDLKGSEGKTTTDDDMEVENTDKVEKEC